MEGGMKDLSPDILNAVDIDIPADTLTMTILIPPTHGTLLNGIYGLEMNRYKNLNPEVLQRTLAIQSFTLQELQQGQFWNPHDLLYHKTFPPNFQGTTICFLRKVVRTVSLPWSSHPSVTSLWVSRLAEQMLQ